MSKLLCKVVFCQSSNWLEHSIEFLLEFFIAEFSLNSGLLSVSIPQDQGKIPRSEKKEPSYKCLCAVAFCQSSNWLEHSVEFLLESFIYIRAKITLQFPLAYLYLLLRTRYGTACSHSFCIQTSVYLWSYSVIIESDSPCWERMCTVW